MVRADGDRLQQAPKHVAQQPRDTGRRHFNFKWIAIGVSVLLENAQLWLFGPIPYQFDSPFAKDEHLVGGAEDARFVRDDHDREPLLRQPAHAEGLRSFTSV